MSLSSGKKAAGVAALKYVKEGMTIGLGTGSTVLYFLEALAEKCRHGLNVTGITTSEDTLRKAMALGIPVAEIEDLVHLDLSVDGADEIDDEKNMIKGGGGALLREKIIAAMSRQRVIIVDETKSVSALGKFPLPVEILPFAHQATLQRIKELGLSGKLRMKVDGALYVTDNHNFIYDIHFLNGCEFPEKINRELLSVPGILETGFFFGLADDVIIGHADGSFEIRS